MACHLTELENVFAEVLIQIRTENFISAGQDSDIKWNIIVYSIFNDQDSNYVDFLSAGQSHVVIRLWTKLFYPHHHLCFTITHVDVSDGDVTNYELDFQLALRI